MSSLSNSNFFLHRLFSIPTTFFRHSLAPPRSNSVLEKKDKTGDFHFGDWWDSSDDNNTTNVTMAYASGQIRSIDDWGESTVTKKTTAAPPRTPVRVKFINKSPHALILCWVSTTGTLHHYYRIAPHASHIEKTFTGDAFLISLVPPMTTKADKKLSFTDIVDDNIQPKKKDGPRNEVAGTTITPKSQLRKDQGVVNEKTIVAAYRPMDVSSPTTDDDDSYNQHLVVLKPYYRNGATRPWTTFLRGRTSTTAQGQEATSNLFKLTVQACESPPIKMRGPLIDTRKKVYKLEMFGPWRVQCEPGCWDIEVDEEEEDLTAKKKRGCCDDAKELFKADLMAITNRLPVHAREKLCKSVTIWVNKSFRHGCIRDPIDEYGACFHPDRKWLKDHKYDVRKLHGVEFYDSSRWYHDDRRLWGMHATYFGCIFCFFIYFVCDTAHMTKCTSFYSGFVILNFFFI